jgi:hypothetical protein
MMPELFLALPSYYEEVAQRLSACDWLLHNFFDDDQNKIYNPAGYLYRQYLEGTEYRACIDLNILQYAVNCVRKEAPNKHYQNACSMLIFCRSANIEIEPALALYERINHGAGDIEEVLDDLAIFRALDNSDPSALAEYMRGDRNSLRHIETPEIDRLSIRNGLTQHRRLVDWDSIYVLILGATKVYYSDNISSRQKLYRFLDWMITEFRISLAALVYATRLFGKIPLAKQMKFKCSSSSLAKKQAIDNMTWDLFLVDHYLKNWANPQKPWEEIVFTQDKVVKELFRMAIHVQFVEGIDPLLRYLHEDQVDQCRDLIDNASRREDRVYLKKEWTLDYRERLIIKLQHDLGIMPVEA